MEATTFMIILILAAVLSGIMAGLWLGYPPFREKKGKTKKIDENLLTDFVSKYKELAKKEFELLKVGGIIKKQEFILPVLEDDFKLNSESISVVESAIDEIESISPEQVTKQSAEIKTYNELISSRDISGEKNKADNSEKMKNEIKKIREYIDREKIGVNINNAFIERLNVLINSAESENNKGKYTNASGYLIATKILFDDEKEKSRLKSREEIKASDVEMLLKDAEDLMNKEKSKRFVDTFFPEFTLKEAREFYKRGEYKLSKELAELSKKMFTDKDSAYKLRRLSEIIDSDSRLP
ncbi:MAG: hypothetical protein BWK75_03230 [Candidatus Altiarchaeales archaeon A3]|nr:MAG: hypothetical protein BWK75_03230 [Candidatus Altiarchaeales archaeon A3]